MNLSRLRMVFFQATLFVTLGLPPLGANAEEIPDQRVPHLPKKFLSIPIVRQQENYSCGPAALLSVLEYWNAFRGTEQELYSLLGTTEKDGTHPLGLKRGAEFFGLQAEFKTGIQLDDLKSALKSGETYILDIQAWPEVVPSDWSQDWEDGHYVILIAIDKKNVYFSDPSTEDAYTFIPISEFLQRWHDYEIEDGQRVEYHHSGVLIQGQSPSQNPPETTRLVRLL